MDLKGIVRKIGRIGDGEYALGLDEHGNITVSKGLPDYARLAAQGFLYAFDTHAGTAKAPVVAMPTTSPEWGLYNDDPDCVLIPVEIACTLKSGTAGLGLSLVVATAIGKQTAVAANYTGAIVSATDGSKDQPNAYITNNPTLVGGTPAWHVMDATRVNTVATDSVGDGLIAKCNGMFSAPPSGMVAFEVVGETGTTALFSVSGIFAMVNLKRRKS